jgi:GH15 family glucan-1,4-alpha-glucosidase
MDAIIHYKRDNYFLLGAMSALGGMLEYATGIKGFGGAEGTWRDAEDGKLSMNPVAQGSVDSAFSVRADMLPDAACEVHAWICAGHSMGDITRLYNHIHDVGFDTLVRETSRYWAAWSDKETERLKILPDPIPSLFRRSLLTIRTNFDNHGAIIAANDSDIMETARAH